MIRRMHNSKKRERTIEKQAKCLHPNTNTWYSAHLLVVLGADKEVAKQLQALRVIWLQSVIDVLVTVSIVCGPVQIDVRLVVQLLF